MRQSDNQRKMRTIYYLVDTGKQMAGDKIGAMNSAMEEAITVDLPDIASSLGEDIEDIKVAVIHFSDGASWITESGAVYIGDVIWNDLHASGANDFGCALRVLAEDLQKFNFNIHNEPIIIVFSNAPVTDSYMEPLEELERYECFQNSLRVGIAIGGDADKNVLTTFTGASECVIEVNDKHSLKELIEKYIGRQRGADMIDLKSILKQYPNCLNSRASFKSVLMDNYPSKKRLVNILTILFECGVVNKIKAKKSIDANEMQALITQIENEYGISGQYSQDAIVVWAGTFDVNAEKIKPSATITKNSIIKEKQASTPGVNVNSVYSPYRGVQPTYSTTGSSSDYDIVSKIDGFYISRFKGFEEDEMIIPNEIDGKKIVGIASKAFQVCVSVKKICLSEGIHVLEKCAFSDCSSLAEIILPNTLTTIGSPTKECTDGVFANTRIKKIIIPDSVTYMGPYTFWYCYDLKSVELSNNLEEIEVALFSSCSELANVKLPQRLKRIKTAAFDECRKLKSIQIPNGTKVIEENAFKGANLSSIYVPPSVTSIATTTSAPNWFFARQSWERDETLGGYATVYCEAGTAAFNFARNNNMKCARAQF